jgi:hypothetical protein
MTSRLLVAALLAALACGGSDTPDPACEPIACGDSCGSVPDGCGGTLSCDACFVPPIVDPTRLGVACPAPEVMITMPAGEKKAAGDLQIGDLVYALPATGGATGEFAVTEATRLTGQQRLRIVFEDGRAPIFTPDHALFVETVPVFCPGAVYPENFTGGWVEIQHLRPGWCVKGQIPGVVARLESAPDGDVIRLAIGDEHGGDAYWGDGLWSLAHNARATPTDP